MSNATFEEGYKSALIDVRQLLEYYLELEDSNDEARDLIVQIDSEVRHLMDGD
jgi:hypothetical protein